MKESETIYCTVDNRVLLLGIDSMYRKYMEELETSILLPQVELVAARLGVLELDVPVEGYYVNNPKAARYFKLMRALQEVDEQALPQVEDLREFQNISKVVSSPIFGTPIQKGKLFPQGRDPLSQALIESPWEAETLVDRAYRVTIENEDISLVGLAARLKDPIVMTALRESVILYAEKLLMGVMQIPQYEFLWEVDDDFAEIANRFIEEFNSFLPHRLRGIPHAEPQNVERFYFAFIDNDILGRCANLGQDQSTPVNYYHWAITRQDGQFALDEFWSTKLWTTQEYKFKQESLGWKLFKDELDEQ
jgi:hypothetical protein